MTTTREEQRDVVERLDDDDLETIVACIKNGQPGRVTPYEIKAMCEEITRLRADAHYNKGVCDLAMKHRDEAEAELARLRASQAGGVPAGWMDISTAPKDDTLFLAACPPDERFPSGRIMIWCGTILAAQNDRTPGHLRFPAKWWMPLPALPVSGGAHAE